MTISPGWRRVLSIALVAAAFGFLGREIFRNLDQLRSFDWDVRVGLLAVSVGCLSAVFFWGVLVWQMLLRSFGARVPYLPLARAWFLSNISRYIPGVVWQFVSLAQLGGSAGLTPTAAVTSLLVQMGFLLLSAGVLGIYLLPANLALGLASLLHPLRWLAPAGLLLVHPAVIQMGVRTIVRVTRREMAPWEGSWADGIWLLLLSGVSWLLYGGAFFLFLCSLVDLPLSALPTVTAINAFAFIVGYLAFFAPGGIGFKEAALGVLLAGLMPAAVAASLAIAARVWTSAAEMLPAVALLRQTAPPKVTG